LIAILFALRGLRLRLRLRLRRALVQDSIFLVRYSILKLSTAKAKAKVKAEKN